MSLVHKTKKEEGKKHKRKKKTQKKQQIFKIKLRNDRFRMFGPHSKPILAVLAWFKADFGLFRSVLAVGRYALILAKSEPSWHESEQSRCKSEPSWSQVDANRSQLRRNTNARVAASVAAPHIGLQCNSLPTPLVLPRLGILCKRDLQSSTKGSKHGWTLVELLWIETTIKASSSIITWVRLRATTNSKPSPRTHSSIETLELILMLRVKPPIQAPTNL